MTYSNAILLVKSLNSPDPCADADEKLEAIIALTGMATLNAITKNDLMRCIKWLLEVYFEEVTTDE